MLLRLQDQVLLTMLDGELVDDLVTSECVPAFVESSQKVWKEKVL